MVENIENPIPTILINNNVVTVVVPAKIAFLRPILTKLFNFIASEGLICSEVVCNDLITRFNGIINIIDDTIVANEYDRYK